MLTLTRKQFNRLVTAYRVGGFFSIVAVLCLYAAMLGKLLEFMLIFTPYFLTRKQYNMQYHSMRMKHCLVLTIVVFSILIAFTLPKEFSINMSAVLGLTTSYISYKAGTVQLKLQDYEYIEPKYNKFVEESARKYLYTLKETKLRDYAASKGLSEEIIDTLVLRVCHNYKWVDIQKERGYTQGGIRYHKERIKEKLNIDKL